MEVLVEKPKPASEEQQNELRRRLLSMILQNETRRRALTRAGTAAPGSQELGKENRKRPSQKKDVSFLNDSLFHGLSQKQGFDHWGDTRLDEHQKCILRLNDRFSPRDDEHSVTPNQINQHILRKFQFFDRLMQSRGVL